MRVLESHADLAICFPLLCLLCWLFFSLGRVVVRRCRSRMVVTAALSTLALTLGFAASWHGQLDLARILPVSSVIVLGNWLPLGAAILGGIAAGQRSIPTWRRTCAVGMLTGLAWYTVVVDLFLASPEPRRPLFWDGVCMQTTADSCSACCAVTLLMEHGIPASEGEIMGLCLTRRGGTPELGLYRGLKLKTRNTPWDVEVLSCSSDAFLRPEIYPALLLVDSESVEDDTPYWWHCRRASHAVVAYGITDSGAISIGDPSSGRTTWTIDQFRQCWLGAGLRLVRHGS